MSGKEVVHIIKANDILTWYDISKKDLKRESVYSKKSYNSKFIADENLNKKVSIIKGDLTRISVDAVVTPASSSLLGGSGIDGQIHRIAGPDLSRECKKLEGCEIGDAKITSGYLLPATFVIHTVPPKDVNEKILTSCYRRCLTVAEGKNLKTVAFPSLAPDSYPPESAAEAALSSVRTYFENHPKTGLEKVIFAILSQNIYSTYMSKIPEIFPVNINY